MWLCFSPRRWPAMCSAKPYWSTAACCWPDRYLLGETHGLGLAGDRPRDSSRGTGWIEQFVREEVEPLDRMLNGARGISGRCSATGQTVASAGEGAQLVGLSPGPGTGRGRGYGQVRLALINEILGRSLFGPIVFGCRALPDSGNGEILARPRRRRRAALPATLALDGDIVSCFAMTKTPRRRGPCGVHHRAVREGDGWLLSGEKWFASNARATPRSIS